MSGDKPLTTPDSAQSAELQSKLIGEVLDTVSGAKSGTASDAVLRTLGSTVGSTVYNAVFGSLFDALSGKRTLGGSADEPKIENLDSALGPYTEKTWTSGPHAGEKEQIFANTGAKIHYSPDGKGGEVIETTSPDGTSSLKHVHTDGKKGKIIEERRSDGTKSLTHAYPDGKGGVILGKNDSQTEENYVARYSADRQSMTVDWKNDGRHLQWHEDEKLNISVTMTGPKPHNNYTATIKDGVTEVKYDDGSSYVRAKDGSETLHGKHSGTYVVRDQAGNTSSFGLKDRFLGSASNYFQSTSAELLGAYGMSRFDIADDVRRLNRR